MCTIGSVFQSSSPGLLSFKQCDLEKPTDFLQPKITSGKGNIRYLPFKRVGSDGPWAGVNNYGVSFVAADAYLEPTSVKTGKPQLKAVDNGIFAAYNKIISDHTIAESAADYMRDFYAGFGLPDILLISDANSSFFIETYQGVVECIERKENFFASTNHFRMLYSGVQYPLNHSTYLRLARAEAILEKKTNASGPFAVLADRYFGETVFSICRENQQTPPQEAPYYTQATVVFYTDGTEVNAAYQLNGNPHNNPYTVIQDVFGTSPRESCLDTVEAAAAAMTQTGKTLRSSPARTFKFSGRIHPRDEKHQLKENLGASPKIIPPAYVYVPGVGNIPQYSPTVFGRFNGYNPPYDCDGNFMSYKFQVNNNCYAYGCVITPNSFPQPGRKNGYLLPKNFNGADVVKGATMDGLMDIGDVFGNLQQHQQEQPGAGHYVALLISPADARYDWPGDYHWVRCDDNVNFNSWSQKDGGDQVTNFDFAGQPIVNPQYSNWTVNQGPISKTNANELVVAYEFYTFMFVPLGGVNIL